MHRHRHEAASVGFDDFLQLVGGDAANTPEGTPIRVPTAPGFRYRVLTAVIDLNPGDAVVGLRQAVELWTVYPTIVDEAPTPPGFPARLPVVTPFWHFVDGFTTWTLTFESVPPGSHRFDPNESRSFAYEDSTSPALVFETVHFPMAPAEPGYLGLDDYTPPGMRGQAFLTMRDIRYPWGENALQTLRIVADGPRRARLYCDVLQTNPATRFNPSDLSAAQLAALCPEDRYTLANPLAARYGAVAGAIRVSRKGDKP